MMSHIPNVLKPITIEELHYPYEMKSNAQLIEFANFMVRPPPSKPVEIFMICDIIQCLITFIACANVMAKKGRLRQVQLVTLRKSPYGTFIVPNAVWIMLAGTCIYLLSWIGFCGWMVFTQWTNRPFTEWLWYIPFPW